MQVQNTPKSNTIYMLMFGGLDDAYAEKLDQHLQSLFGEDFDEVVFNFSNVTVFTRDAIDKFLEFHQTLRSRGKRMRIDGVNEYVSEVLQSMQFDNLPQ